MKAGKRGSSPRGRGTRELFQKSSVHNRFIPAWAGNTPRASTRPRTSPVHPRVGGEHKSSLQELIKGLGSSPRGRGTQGFDDPENIDRRFIPAWAGNTYVAKSTYGQRPVHPRVGGEHARGEQNSFTRRGSSPRGRGTLDGGTPAARPGRFIPAWAGNTRGQKTASEYASVHPRVGGEHALPGQPPLSFAGSSPRGRGTPNRGQRPA